MNQDILFIAKKQYQERIELINVYKNGNVEFKNYAGDSLIDSKVLNIDIVNELQELLIGAYNLMVEIYNESKIVDNKTTIYSINYNNHNFYSMNLYLDLVLMIKSNKIKTLSVFKLHEEKLKKEKIEKQIFENMKILDEMEKNKIEIDLSDVEINDDFISNRKIISFKLREKNEFDLGESRFFSDIIDIPNDLKIPEGMEFIGQINLSEMNKYDINNLLPKAGMLYFFQSPSILGDKFYDVGKVLYSEDTNYSRKKLTNINQDLILNFAISNIDNIDSNFNDRYDENLEYIDDYEDDLNKIYGFFIDYMMSDEDIKKVSSKYVVLLQLGSDIYGEGVTTFLIAEEDLKNKNFDNIIYRYVQS